MKVSIILLASGQVGKCPGHPFLNFPEPPCRSLSPTQNPMKLYTEYVFFTAPQDKSESS